MRATRGVKPESFISESDSQKGRKSPRVELRRVNRSDSALVYYELIPASPHPSLP